jgi:hypothetical protein
MGTMSGCGVACPDASGPRPAETTTVRTETLLQYGTGWYDNICHFLNEDLPAVRDASGVTGRQNPRRRSAVLRRPQPGRTADGAAKRVKRLQRYRISEIFPGTSRAVAIRLRFLGPCSARTRQDPSARSPLWRHRSDPTQSGSVYLGVSGRWTRRWTRPNRVTTLGTP